MAGAVTPRPGNARCFVLALLAVTRGSVADSGATEAFAQDD
eukprot:CAMPEP_0198546072 /NCGR_PEP_ID=MMETSP1462-20131121/66204_1 /TAXON_ID=1333877 /ORGANISM="Brandtodinium nutriculum, Strain RCC3387" /LENGTH=40 /DNA_ID= /DNA_START= /DNA_END= /DNA_ORIENTATION=